MHLRGLYTTLALPASAHGNLWKRLTILSTQKTYKTIQTKRFKSSRSLGSL